jgi:hypothetical protein
MSLNYFGRITSTKWPFLCNAQDKPVTYDAKDPTETKGSISVQIWTMRKPVLIENDTEHDCQNRENLLEDWKNKNKRQRKEKNYFFDK